MKYAVMRTCLVLMIVLLLAVSSDFLDLAGALSRAKVAESPAQATGAERGSPPDTPTHGPPVAGMGIMVGEVTPSTALVQVRLTADTKLVKGDVAGRAGIVEFELTDDGVGRQQNRLLMSQRVPAEAERDFIARARFTGLVPGTRYRCTTRIGADSASLETGPVASFRTLPGPQREQDVRFVVVTGMNYAKFHGDDRIDRKIHLLHNNTELPPPYSGPDKHLGYPGLASILSLKPDFFIGTGDNVYYDTPKKPRAETLKQMRQKWHEQFVQPRYRKLFAAVPTYWEIDDHDYRIDDGDNSGDYQPSPALGRRVMLEQLPLAAAGDSQATTYRTHRVSRDLQIWLVENRMYRSPNAMPDGPQKSIWGARQKAWLMRTLQDSDATYKLLISPTPMVGPDDLRKSDNHTNIKGFRHERDAFFAWLRDTGLHQKNFYLICGDRHWQYHALHPSGIEEFSCGALVDANSRLGRKPGDPKSTDPQALIKQLYSQNPRSGGFLQVQVSPAGEGRKSRMTLRFHDEHGKILHKLVK